MPGMECCVAMRVDVTCQVTHLYATLHWRKVVHHAAHKSPAVVRHDVMAGFGWLMGAAVQIARCKLPCVHPANNFRRPCCPAKTFGSEAHAEQSWLAC